MLEINLTYQIHTENGHSHQSSAGVLVINSRVIHRSVLLFVFDAGFSVNTCNNDKKQHTNKQNTHTHTHTCLQTELQHDQTYVPSLIRVFAVCMQNPWVLGYPLSPSEDTDQTRRMPRLIWVFAGRTYVFVGFVIGNRLVKITRMFKGNTKHEYVKL